MRIIFHIGMGKTGTTSIQQALAQSADSLAGQKAHYLGMWFDQVSPKFSGLAGFGRFLAQPPDEIESAAENFFKHLETLKKETKATTFIFSNESLFQNGPRMEPFFRTLEDLGATLQFIAYLRDPRDWLPSAHTQWALRHKTNKGGVQDFATSARRLIRFYDGIGFWLTHFKSMTAVREAAIDQDVVADFADALGVRLTPSPSRALERSEPADTLMRAMFNDREPDTALPTRFNTRILNTEARPVPSAQEVAKICFDHSAGERVIAENAEIFEFIRDRVGIDFLSRPKAADACLDEVEMQRRVIDYLVEISFDQAQRLERLEGMIEKMLKD